jgi:hypothetical protein
MLTPCWKEELLRHGWHRLLSKTLRNRSHDGHSPRSGGSGDSARQRYRPMVVDTGVAVLYGRLGVVQYAGDIVLESVRTKRDSIASVWNRITRLDTSLRW